MLEEAWTSESEVVLRRAEALVRGNKACYLSAEGARSRSVIHKRYGDTGSLTQLHSSCSVMYNLRKRNKIRDMAGGRKTARVCQVSC